VADKKPLYDATQVTEFGGIEDMESFRAEGVAQRDYTYVPGFSEMRVQRDVDLKRHANGEIRAQEISILPVNARWFRQVKGSGSDPDQMRVAHARNQGYRVVTKADIGQPWLKEVPPGGMVAPDGTIKSAAGDLGLFVIDQQGAARNAMQKKIRTEDMVDGMQFKPGGLGDIGTKAKADPMFTKTTTEVTK
jgi:hypothetical protein